MSRNAGVKIVFVAAAACLGLYMSRGPWLAYRDQKAKADAATKDMQKAEQQKNELIREKAKIETPMGREALARGIGLRKAGEEPVTAGN